MMGPYITVGDVNFRFPLVERCGWRTRESGEKVKGKGKGGEAGELPYCWCNSLILRT